MPDRPGTELMDVLHYPLSVVVVLVFGVLLVVGAGVSVSGPPEPPEALLWQALMVSLGEVHDRPCTVIFPK